MKKYLALLFSGILIFALCACGDGADSSADQDAGGDDLSYEEMEQEEGAPVIDDDRLIDETALDPLEIAGSYSGTNDETCSVNIYTSIDEDSIEVGDLEVVDISGETLYAGTICMIADNLYELQVEIPVTFSVYTDNGTVGLDMYVNGEHENYFVMTEPYVS